MILGSVLRAVLRSVLRSVLRLVLRSVLRSLLKLPHGPKCAGAAACVRHCCATLLRMHPASGAILPLARAALLH